MKAVLATFGTLGDLHPFVGLGMALRARGWDVIVAADADHRTKVERAGLTFTQFGADFKTAQMTTDLTEVEFYHRTTSDHRYVIDTLILPYFEAGVYALREAAKDADVLICSNYALAANSVARELGVPLVGVALQPTVLLSAYDPPLMKGVPFIHTPNNPLAVAWNKLTLAVAQHVSAHAFRPIRAEERRLGLKPAPLGVVGVRGPELNLGLFSPMLAKPQKDHPAGLRIFGPALFDSEDGSVPDYPRDLETWLNAGEAPYVFTLGSTAVWDGEEFYRSAIAASRQLKSRCLALVGPHSPLLGEEFGPDVKILPYAAHSLVFPRAKAVIHHGGAGSTAQGMRAGRPQVVTPVFADQFDNAARLQRLGCARVVPSRAWTMDSAVAALTGIDILEFTAKRIAEAARKEDGAAAAADFLTQRFGDGAAEVLRA